MYIFAKWAPLFIETDRCIYLNHLFLNMDCTEEAQLALEKHLVINFVIKSKKWSSVGS
jgi:hypothetical protein